MISPAFHHRGTGTQRKTFLGFFFLCVSAVIHLRQSFILPDGRRLATPIQTHLLDVVRHRRIYEFRQRPLCCDRVSNRCRRNILMHVFQQMHRRSSQNYVALCRLLGKRLGHCQFRTQLFRQRIGYIGKGKSGTARHDEFTFAEKRGGFVPGPNIFERVDADQEEKAIALPECLFQSSNCVDGVIRARLSMFCLRLLTCDLLVYDRSCDCFCWSFQKGWHECFLVPGRHRHHGVTMEEGGNRVPLFVGWNVRRSEMHAAKLETFPCSLRYGDVPVVNGIEGSAKQSDVHNVSNSQALCCFAPCIS
jgi:hypothetical protein